MIHTYIIPVLDDNYAYVLEAENGNIAVIDPGDKAPVIEFLETKKLLPTHLFLTHHHGDHIAGAKEIKDKYNCQVFGPAAESEKIKCLDIHLDERSDLSFGGETVQIIETPGHTLGQINFYFPESHVLFSGDTLFVMGCGRVFEGTMDQMYASLQKLKQLPDETLVYCGHEYTLSNIAFLRSIDPDNPLLEELEKEFKELRAQDKPTIPSTLGTEKQGNLFLKVKNAEAFAKIRSQKDNF